MLRQWEGPLGVGADEPAPARGGGGGKPCAGWGARPCRCASEGQVGVREAHSPDLEPSGATRTRYGSWFIESAGATGGAPGPYTHTRARRHQWGAPRANGGGACARGWVPTRARTDLDGGAGGGPHARHRHDWGVHGGPPGGAPVGAAPPCTRAGAAGANVLRKRQAGCDGPGPARGARRAAPRATSRYMATWDEHTERGGGARGNGCAAKTLVGPAAEARGGGTRGARAPAGARTPGAPRRRATPAPAGPGKARRGSAGAAGGPPPRPRSAWSRGGGRASGPWPFIHWGGGAPGPPHGRAESARVDNAALSRGKRQGRKGLGCLVQGGCEVWQRRGWEA
jgi:hypothetical protein